MSLKDPSTRPLHHIPERKENKLSLQKSRKQVQLDENQQQTNELKTLSTNTGIILYTMKKLSRRTKHIKESLKKNKKQNKTKHIMLTCRFAILIRVLSKNDIAATPFCSPLPKTHHLNSLSATPCFVICKSQI